MISLKEACQKILSRHPGEYIHVVNEYSDGYEFILLNEGEEMTNAVGLILCSTVNKHTGEIQNNLLAHEVSYEGEYKQYTRNEIEGL